MPYRIKKCDKICLDMVKCGSRFSSHTFYGLPHLSKVNYDLLLLGNEVVCLVWMHIANC